mmetsp:Transcript_22375/g.46362  ORF Transcript_22375/g.46362 Transcript_22375/m.46362 type:complete len:463 (-) Transcript_22375:123-1511(-)
MGVLMSLLQHRTDVRSLLAPLADAPPVMMAGCVAAGLALPAGLVLSPLLPPLWKYWRTLLFFWTGGRYADAGSRLGLSKFSRAHLYSLASVPWLMQQPHYRTGTFQQDMLTNLRNVVMPTGLFGVPLSICARSRVHAVLTAWLVIPAAAFVGSWWRKLRGLEASASECFARSLLAPTDWFQLWRLNCRLASMTSLATQSKDFELEDKWVFIKTCMEKGIPVTPVMDQPVTLIAKDVLEEGGMGIHVLKNVLHGGRWILQEKLDNCDAVKQLLPDAAPLSTMRVLTGSLGALAALGSDAGKNCTAQTLATVWRAGRKGANTDHSCVMVDVPGGKVSEVLGGASSSAHWYASGWKSLGMPLSTKDGCITAHPDTGLELKGKVLPSASAAAKLCERAHDALMPEVPLAGWDVAFCPAKDGGSQPDLVLLEANLSCNFFRGSIAWEEYSSLLDEHFAAIDAWRQRK